MNPHSGLSTVTLNVSHERDARNNERLIYAPVSPDIDGPGDITAGEPAYHTIEPKRLQLALEDACNKVLELALLASAGKPRNEAGIEEVAQRLAQIVLPPHGFSGILPPGLHPRFYSLHDIAEEIPWECLEEYCGECRNPDCRLRDQTKRLEAAQAQAPSYCAACGNAQSKTGGKLVLDRRISHYVHGGKRVPWEGGREFLMILDPRGDLYLDHVGPGASKMTSAPQQVIERAQLCQAACDRLYKMLRAAGYNVKVLAGANATARNVLNDIMKPGLVGIYYFGHGVFPKNQDQGRLLVANNEEVSANHIKAHGTTARFVFLNACWGAAAAAEWGLGRKSQSVGSAFAYGSRVALAPLWPIYSVQAVEAAELFFNAALAGQSLMDATAEMRKQCYARYAAGEPNISWMAYRYFGPCDRRLPKPADLATTAPPVASQQAISRVFKGDDKLDFDIFDFRLEPILFRAAKRKLLQKRAVVSASDLLAGWLRKGSLLRYALSKVNLEPDQLYALIVEHSETDSAQRPASANPDAEEAREKLDEKGTLAARFQAFLKRFIVRHLSDFAPSAVQVFRAADAAAQRKSGGPRLITERDLLTELLKSNPWPDIPRFPQPETLRQALEIVAREGVVDDNGSIRLTGLEPDAARVIETAHDLAQQRGSKPISNRLMLAAFLANSQGVAPRLFRNAHMSGSPELCKDALVASTPQHSSENFPLTPDVCDRIVWPMYRRAQALAGEGKTISPAWLFAAFCQTTAPEFKQMMRKVFRIDLDVLGNIAAQWAQGNSVQVILQRGQ